MARRVKTGRATKKTLSQQLAKQAETRIRNFNVSVDYTHIRRAKPNTQAWCMVALAIRDCIEGAHTVRVDTSFIRFSIGNTSNGGVRYAFPTPTKVVRPIQLFDQEANENKEHTIKPFGFQLSAIQGYINPMIRRSNSHPLPRTSNEPKSCVKRYRWNGQPVILDAEEGAE